MNTATLTQDSRLTDAIERDLVRSSYEQPAQARILPAIGAGVRGLGRAVKTFASYFGAVGEGLNEARRASARFTGSQW